MAKFHSNIVVNLVESFVANPREYDAMFNDRYTGWFIENCIVDLTMPRQAGHTSAAVTVLEKYENAMLLVGRPLAVTHVIKMSPDNIADRIYTLNKLPEYRFSPSATYAKISGQKPIVIVDLLSMTYDRVHEIITHVDPQLIVSLGNAHLRIYTDKD